MPLCDRPLASYHLAALLMRVTSTSRAASSPGADVFQALPAGTVGRGRLGRGGDGLAGRLRLGPLRRPGLRQQARVRVTLACMSALLCNLSGQPRVVCSQHATTCYTHGVRCRRQALSGVLYWCACEPSQDLREPTLIRHRCGCCCFTTTCSPTPHGAASTVQVVAVTMQGF